MPGLLWAQPPPAELARRLGNARADGGLVLSAPIYAELLAYPKATEPFAAEFISKTGIVPDFSRGEQAWREAGRRFARYAARRRRSKSEQPKRLLADFIIAAHALANADRLMTLDPDRYRRDFPELQLI